MSNILIDKDALIPLATQDKKRYLYVLREEMRKVATDRRRISLQKKIEKEECTRVTNNCKWVLRIYRELLAHALKHGYCTVSGVGAGVGKTTFAIQKFNPAVSKLEDIKDKECYFVIVSGSDKVKSQEGLYANAEINYVIDADHDTIERQRESRAQNPKGHEKFRPDLQSSRNAPITAVVPAKFATYYPDNTIYIWNDGQQFHERGPIASCVKTVEQIKEERKSKPPVAAIIGNFALGPTVGHDRILQAVIKKAQEYGTKPLVMISRAARKVTLPDGNTLQLSYDDREQSFKDVYGDNVQCVMGNFNNMDIASLNIKSLFFGSDRFNDRSYVGRFAAIFDDAEILEVKREEENLDNPAGFSSSMARKALETGDLKTFFKIHSPESSKRYLKKYGVIPPFGNYNIR